MLSIKVRTPERSSELPWIGDDEARAHKNLWMQNEVAHEAVDIGKVLGLCRFNDDHIGGSRVLGDG